MFSTRFGWPLPAMQYRWEAVVLDGKQTMRRLPSIASPDWLENVISSFKTRFPAKRRLPLVPLWPGFLINTLLYAAMFWGILRLRGTVRTAIRRRRHQCPGCGYPIGESLRCTECGASVAVVDQKESKPALPT